MSVVDEPRPEIVTTPVLQRSARVTLILVLVALGLWTLHDFLIALVWAAILAVAVDPAYRRVESHWPGDRHHIVLPALTATLIAVVFLLPFVLLGLQAIREAHDLLNWASEAMRSGIPVPAWVNSLPVGAPTVTAWWNENLAEPTGLADLTHKVTNDFLKGRTREFGVAITHRVVTFFFMILALFFLLRSADAVKAQLLRASAKLFGPSGERIGRQMVASVHGTVDGLVLVGLGEGLLLGIAFAVAGVPHPTLLGAAAAVAAMIPFAIILVLAVVGALLLAKGAVAAAVAVLVFGIVVNFIADHFIRPGLIGGATKLPFLWVLLGVLGGVETWGLVGLFLGPALMSALILLWRELVRPEPAAEPPHRAARTLSPVPIAQR